MSSKAFDLDRARRDTPGCEGLIHFNNAGASLMPQPVLEAVIDHLRLEASIGGYEAAAHAKRALARVYDAAARLIGSQPDEIAVVENATRAWDMAFYAIPFKPGDRILTSMAEYASNYIAFLQVARRTGARIEVIPNEKNGQVSVQALRDMVDENVKLIAITHVPTNGGLVNPAADVGAVAQEIHTLYLLDACQSVGQVPVNVQEIGCDMLSVTGRKYLRGPRGTGFLYVRREIIPTLEPPLLDLHAATWIERDRFEIRQDARRFENWEANYAGKIGLGVAIDYAQSWGIEPIWARVSTLAENLRDHLRQIPGVQVQDQGVVKCGIVSFTVEGKEPKDIKRQLNDRGINISISTVASTRLEMEARGLQSLNRASVHYFNTVPEIETFCEAIAEL